MSRAGFYATNELRAYPFQVGGQVVNLPTQAIVDFGCVMGAGSGYVQGTHKVWLSSVSYYDELIRFEFKTDAPGLVARSLTFVFNVNDAEFTTRFSTDDVALGSSAAYAPNACENEVVWEGYMVCGLVYYALYAAVSEIPGGALVWQTVVDGMLWKNHAFLMEQIFSSQSGESSVDNSGSEGGTIEPALVQSMSGTYVSSINLANAPRTKATAPAGCTESLTGPEDNYVNVKCITGDVKIKSGYSSYVTVSVADNSIIIGGDVGGGEGQPCSEIPIYSSEQPPEGSVLLSGGPSCGETLKSINGIGGKNVILKGGLGVSVKASELLENTIIVTPDHHGLALCASNLS